MKKAPTKKASIRKKIAKSLEVSEKVPIIAASIHKIDYPVSFRVGAGPYRHRPVLKSCFGGSLFIIPLYKRLEEVAALNRSSFQKYRLLPLNTRTSMAFGLISKYFLMLPANEMAR